MKRNNISTIFLVILSLQFIYFLYQLRNLVPFVLNSNILLCDSCLQGLISTIIIITLTISVFAGLSLAISHIKTFRFKNKIKRSVVSKPKSIAYFEKKHNLHNKIIVYQDSQLMAFCLGIFTPHIYLSTRLLNKMNRSEVEAIILHEKQHIVGGDNMKLLILNFIKTIFFFLSYN
jgi:Zn-dependent protease with chaperone function